MSADRLRSCEYFDVHQKRNHIWACLCNGDDFDEETDSSWISGRPSTHRQRAMKGCSDRLRIRIPWVGGAKKVPAEATIPMFILVPLYLLASLNFIYTILSLYWIPCILLYSYYSRKKCTTFFLSYFITSYGIVFATTQLLKASIETSFIENLLLYILSYIVWLCVYLIVKETDAVKMTAKHRPEDLENKKLYNTTLKSDFCAGCQAHIAPREFHCVWLNTCVGSHNKALFFTLITCMVSTLFYTCAIIFSSICRMGTTTIGLLPIYYPEDCSEVYFQYELSYLYVIAIHTAANLLFLLLLLTYHLFLVILRVSKSKYKLLFSLPKQCCAIVLEKVFNCCVLSIRSTNT